MRQTMLVATLLAMCSGTVLADVEIEVPVLILEIGDSADAVDDWIDETLLVKFSAKRLETVMETSSIVTIVTREEIIAGGYRKIADLLDDVPGFEGWRSIFFWSRRSVMARGHARTILVLWNGVSLNNTHFNTSHLLGDIPLETVDRVEVVSGPGGVLWGANAYLGIVNIVTLRGDSVDYAKEARLAIGTGVGNREALRASASFAETLLDGDLSVYFNLSLNSTRDAVLDVPYDVYLAPFPGTIDGQITLRESTGPVDPARDVCLPITLALDYALPRGSLSFDFLGNYYCHVMEEVDARGVRVNRFTDEEDVLHVSESTTWLTQTTAAHLRWVVPFGTGNRVVSRAFFTGFQLNPSVQTLAPAGQFGDPPITATYKYEGMNRLLNDASYRSGGAVELAVEGTRNSLLAGVDTMVEGLRPWIVNGAGTDVLTIFDDGVLVNGAKRLVLAAYANDKLKVSRRFAVELAGRVQTALGSDAVDYDPLFIPSAALIWNVKGATYLKLNYAEGFRPPGLAAVSAGNDDSLGTFYGGNADLKPERSRAIETEVSTVILRGKRTIRRVHLRFGYQFSLLSDVILGESGFLRNAGRRALHTVETSVDVRFKAGHRLALSGHFFRGNDADLGPIRHVANVKLRLGAYFKISTHLRSMIAATLLGAREDLNRLALESEVLGLDFIMPSGSVVVDRTPPVGLLRASVRAVDLWDDRFDVALYVENALDARPPVPDVDYEKLRAVFPVPMPGRSMMLTVTGKL